MHISHDDKNLYNWNNCNNNKQLLDAADHDVTSYLSHGRRNLPKAEVELIRVDWLVMW